MRRSGINLAEVKERNRALLLQSICTAKTITRSALSECLQLSPMTVTNITSELLQKNIIEEIQPQEHSRTPGRTPMLLRIAPTSPVIAGVFLTKSCLYGIIGDLSLRELGRAKCPLGAQETAQTLIEKIQTLVDELLQCTDRPCCGLGISTAGVLNAENTGIAYITCFYDITSIELRAPLEAYFHFPVYISNDMQSAGLSELYFGYGREHDNFLYIGLTVGLGAATVSNHEVLDACGELGHISIDVNGPHCNCGGNGCLEMYASTPAILSRIEEECGVHLTDLTQAVQFSLTNRTAYAILYNAVTRLAYGINNYLNLFSAPLVVFGHDGANLPDELIAEMEKQVLRMNVSKYHNKMPPRFVKSGFGADAPLFGSLCIVLQQMFSGNYPLEALHGCAAGEYAERI